MTPKVTVADYGLGNIRSITNALFHLGASVQLTNDPSEILKADRLIVPGVGAFASGMARLNESGLADSIRKHADRQRPILGICLGFQMMCLSSEEFGLHEGLGLLKARIKKFPKDVRVPHVGWESVEIEQARQSVDLGIKEGAKYYFIHSFCADLVSDYSEIYWSKYMNTRFVAGCAKDNVFGLQFHPEKSGSQGLHILEKFIKI